MNAKNDSITARGRPRAVLLVLGLALLLLLATGHFLTDILNPVPVVASAEKKEQVEPHAGEWQTWILASGSELRLPPPPDKATTKDEIDELVALAAQRDAAALAQIAYWSSGAPAYRWNEIARDILLKNTVAGHGAERVLALMNVAIYDATIAAWDSKYTYDRPRPSEFRSAVETVIPNPASPSYPSEHAVAAAARLRHVNLLLVGGRVRRRSRPRVVR